MSCLCGFVKGRESAVSLLGVFCLSFRKRKSAASQCSVCMGICSFVKGRGYAASLLGTYFLSVAS